MVDNEVKHPSVDICIKNISIIKINNIILLVVGTCRTLLSSFVICFFFCICVMQGKFSHYIHLEQIGIGHTTLGCLWSAGIHLKTVKKSEPKKDICVPSSGIICVFSKIHPILKIMM